jgi:hypothetical protein
VVARLPRKRKALSSNTNTEGKKEKAGGHSSDARMLG